MAATGIAIAFAASLGILVCPVGGAVAAPPTVQVDVANSATNPAPSSSVDDPGRTAYEGAVNCVLVNNIVCKANFAAVPQGHRLVVQHISAQLEFATDPVLVDVVTQGSPNQGSSSFFVPSLANQSISRFDQAVLQYFEAGSTPVVVINGIGSVLTASVPQAVTLTGYLLNCNAATPCAPIAP